DLVLNQYNQITDLMRVLLAACFIWIIIHDSCQVKGDCKSELGMQNKLIPDEKITASSQLSANHTPAFARLDNPKGAWCSAPNDSLPYIQILLDEEKSITTIMTQGSYKESRWATKYQIKYLKEGKWSSYKKKDGSLTFDGNFGVSSLQEIDLQPPIRTHSIRIYPKVPGTPGLQNAPRNLDNVSCLRLELYGCSAPAPCPDPGVPGNGSRSGDDFKHDKSVTFQCLDDFERKGDAVIRCRDGRWVGNIPKCKVISCGDPGSPANGRQSKVSNNFAFGGFVRFKCDKNYTLKGNKKLTCQRNKKWNGVSPECLASCPDRGHPINGKAIGSVFVHDSVVQFECLNGRSLDGSSVVKCNDGKWNAELPTCIDCGGGVPLGMTSGDIPHKSIKASSEKDGHPARHGRLGGDSYWCSKKERTSYIQIHLPRKYKITAVGIHFKSKYNIRVIMLKAQVLNEWRDLHQQTVTASLYNHKIKLYFVCVREQSKFLRK
ncbi:Sushi, von Willebrand factor type A, EGF and pentraxin, partial [Desmophyllum pertusum]